MWCFLQSNAKDELVTLVNSKNLRFDYDNWRYRWLSRHCQVAFLKLLWTSFQNHLHLCPKYILTIQIIWPNQILWKFINCKPHDNLRWLIFCFLETFSNNQFSRCHLCYLRPQWCIFVLYQKEFLALCSNLFLQPISISRSIIDK